MVAMDSSISEKDHPMLDKSGNCFSQLQENENLFFLAGAFDGFYADSHSSFFIVRVERLLVAVLSLITREY
jgi:hypothetical protein